MNIIIACVQYTVLLSSEPYSLPPQRIHIFQADIAPFLRLQEMFIYITFYVRENGGRSRWRSEQMYITFYVDSLRWRADGGELREVQVLHKKTVTASKTGTANKNFGKLLTPTHQIIQRPRWKCIWPQGFSLRSFNEFCKSKALHCECFRFELRSFNYRNRIEVVQVLTWTFHEDY